MDVILLTGRREARPARRGRRRRRGYARNFLLPRKLAETATPGEASPSCASARTKRARHEAQTLRAGAGDRADARGRPSCASTSRPARPGTLFGSVTPTDIADELWAYAEDPRRPAQDRAARADQADRPLRDPDRASSRGRPSRCKTLVVPEGGELPPEEELDAIAAAEAEAEAAAQPRREAAARGGRGRDRGRRRRRGAEAEAESTRGRAPSRRRTSAAEPRHGDCGRERTGFSTGAARACGIAHELPAPSGKSPTGVVRGSWEHVFPYACKRPHSALERPVESASSRPSAPRRERG